MPSANQPGVSKPERGLAHDPGAGWLTDRPFLTQPTKKRVGGAFGVSLILHLLLFLGVIAVLTVPGASEMLQQQTANVVYVFTPQPGPGGGGGGGGTRSPEPPKKAELEVPKPVVAEPTPIPKPVVETPPTPVLPPITTQAPITVPGSVTLSAPTLSGGSGTGGGAGTGRGTGSGEGTGSGVGPGSGGGTGGGVYRPGSLVTNPEVLKEVKPAYTAEAMRAKIQGAVEIEGVVMPDGTLDSPRIVRSLDKMHGLDQKALEAVKAWRFRPGRLKSTGQAVPILVTIELTFTLR
jgi:TonB family protein